MQCKYWIVLQQSTRCYSIHMSNAVPKGFEGSPGNQFQPQTLKKIGDWAIAILSGPDVSREGVDVLVKTANRHLRGVGGELNSTIAQINSGVRYSTKAEKGAWNVAALSRYLMMTGNREMPLLAQEMCRGQKVYSLIHALQVMNPLMQRYEESNGAVGLGFGVHAAIAAARPRNNRGVYYAFVDGTMQVASRYLVHQLGEPDGAQIPIDFGAGMSGDIDLSAAIIGAFLEVPAFDPQLSSFGYLAAAKEMGMFESPQFSPAVRARLAKMA